MYAPNVCTYIAEAKFMTTLAYTGILVRMSFHGVALVAA